MARGAMISHFQTVSGGTDIVLPKGFVVFNPGSASLRLSETRTISSFHGKVYNQGERFTA